jgi:hypothetical protein
VRVAFAHPRQRRQGIVEFALAAIILALAPFGPTKIEAQGGQAATDEGPAERVCHLVVHGATVLRMRVTDDGGPVAPRIARRIENGLEPAGRPR